MRGAETASAGRRGAAGLRIRAALTVLVLATLLPGAVPVAWIGLGAAPARAHSRVGPAAVSAGLAIANLTHGEMAVMARYAPAVRALAGGRARTDPTFRRLANFAALQRAYCLWGLMPGSLADEDSPFNACLHAYLAAVRALLVHMQDMPDQAGRARALADEIALAMAAGDAASDLCRNSADAFTTAQVIVPEWRGILGHPPTVLVFTGLAIMAGTGAWAVFGTGRTRP